MNFLTLSMSYHTLERLALAFLVILVVLAVGLTSTSTGEEAEAPAAASPAPALPPSELTTVCAIGVQINKQAARVVAASLQSGNRLKH
jgi:hypothetical protein